MYQYIIQELQKIESEEDFNQKLAAKLIDIGITMNIDAILKDNPDFGVLKAIDICRGSIFRVLDIIRVEKTIEKINLDDYPTLLELLQHTKTHNKR